MKCRDCHNTEVFVIGYMCYDKVYLDRAGNQMDAKGISCEDVGVKPKCYECDSENVLEVSA
jgi:hypothetical protein